MNKTMAKKIIQDLLQSANITINGPRECDIQIHNESFYTRVINEGALGLGESYMDQWWDCKRLDVFFEHILRAELDTKIKIPFRFYIKILLSNIINFQSKRRAPEVAIKHYNIGNTLFQNMLDKRMIYSCGYWKNNQDLEDAQIAKLDLICKKLQLHPGLKLVDIGCGWGGLAKYAAEHYGVDVVGITISHQQFEYAKNDCKGLPIDIRLQDYRDLTETFDRVVSVGMFEHVGHMNYSAFMHTVRKTLTDDGLFLLHTIGANITGSLTNEWIIKYIFPNGMLPSATQLAKASENLFVMEDWQNFGAYYDLTLMAWYERFVSHWDELKSLYDERFYRMWTYYLLSCAGSFRARATQLWQIVYSKFGITGGYISPR